MMLSLFLSIILLPLLANAEVKEKIPLGDSLTDEDGCKFTFPDSGTSYNLCPLFKDHGHAQEFITWNETTPPTMSMTTIRWNFAGPLTRVEGRKESDQCPKGTWICLKEKNRKIVDPPETAWRITKLIPIAGELVASDKHGDHQGHADEDVIKEDTKIDITASLETTWGSGGKGILHLRMHGGTYVQHPQHAVFTMRCNSTISEPTLPSYPYGRAWNGTHYFSWHTRHACPTSQQATPMPPPGKVEPRPKAGKGKDKDEEDWEKPPSDEGDSFASTPRPWSKLKVASLAIACLMVGGLIFHLAHTGRISTKRIYFALRTFALYHPLAPLYRRFTFRLGESGFGLLRWARRRAGYESLGREQMLFDAELYETDGWVNGGTNGSDEDGTVVGEEDGLPFASPRKSSFGVKSYGTR